jgi:hypothetical protein
VRIPFSAAHNLLLRMVDMGNLQIPDDFSAVLNVVESLSDSVIGAAGLSCSEGR